jgi:hypothetical protein
MKSKKPIALDPSRIGNGIKRLKERFYVKNHFRNYVTENATYRDGNILYPDYRTHIMTQVIEYTKGLFTLPQLYCMFMANEPEGAGWFYSDLNHYKMNVIKYIDESIKRPHDLGDIECFKRKVMELNPVIFNVLNDLMYYSQLFWDAENEEFKYPEIEESQENYNNQNLIS